MSINNKKINLDTSKIFKVDESVEYISILHSKYEYEENNLCLVVYDKYTEEKFSIDIIDFENVENLNLDLKILNDFVYVLYQDREKIFILKYEIGFESVNLVDISENLEDFYINDFIPNNYSLFLLDRYLYFYYISDGVDKKTFHLYKFGNNLNIICEILLDNISNELYFNVNDKNYILIDQLNNFYLKIDKTGNYNQIINNNLKFIPSSINNYQNLKNNYNQLCCQENCIGYYKNIVYLNIDNGNRDNINLDIDTLDEKENLTINLTRNLNTKLDLFVNDKKIINLMESNRDIIIYQFDIINNHLLIVYSDEELDDIYNLKNVSVVNLDNNQVINYSKKFEKCYILNDGLFFVNYRRYQNKKSLSIKHYDFRKKEMINENIFDFEVNKNIDFISKCQYKIMFLLNNENSRNLDSESELFDFQNKETEEELSYLWISERIVNATANLTTSFKTNKYIISNKGDDVDVSKEVNNILVLGLGTYIIEGFDPNYPVAFDLSNNSNIRYEGLGMNLYMVKREIDKKKKENNILVPNILEYPHYPYRLEDTNKNYIFFYYGAIKIVVTGEFDEIPGYYIYDVHNEVVLNNSEPISLKIRFDSTSTPGNTNEKELEERELIERKKYIFYHNGTTDNGIEVKGFDRKGFDRKGNSLKGTSDVVSSYQKEIYYSYVESYCDNISNCLYIRSNGIPNYKPYGKINNLNLNLEFSPTNFNNNGLDRQAFSYISNSRRILGFPLKIPLNPNLTDLKTIPANNLVTYPENLKSESFWYKSDENWEKIMVNTKYNNNTITNDGTNILLPLGQIGIAVNGIPFYSPFNMKNNISESTIEGELAIKDPIIRRVLNTSNVSTSIKDLVDTDTDTNFDFYGGSVDINSVYNYKRYPIGLEADILLGSLGYTSVDDSLLTNGPTTDVKREYYINKQKKILNDMIFNHNSNLIDDETKGIKIISIKKYSNNSKLYINLSEFSLNIYKSYSVNSIKLNSDTGTEVTSNFNINLRGKFGEGINPNLYIEFDSIDSSSESFYFDIDFLKKDNSTAQNLKFQVFFSPSLVDENNLIYLKQEKKSGESKLNIYKSLFRTGNTNSDIKFDRYNGVLLDTDQKSFLEFMKTYKIHSPILGWSFDGFPIYGPVGYISSDLSANFVNNTTNYKFIRNSYQGKKYLQKSTTTTSGDIDELSGDLDFCNGIFRATPEFPEGIYHYVCAIELDVGDKINSSPIKYKYPYIIGAYKGVPDINNFALISSDSGTSSSSSSSYSSSSSTTTATTNSSVVVSETQNYNIKFRSIKADTYNYNSNQYRSIGISQDDDFIKIHAKPQPYIWNLTGSKNDTPTQDAKFGLDNEVFGATSNSISEIFKNDNVYGDIYKFICTDGISEGGPVKLEFSNEKIQVSPVSVSEPEIFGICIKKFTENEVNYAYIMTKGICKFNLDLTDFSSTDNKLIYKDSSKLKKLNAETNSIYVAGTYIGLDNSDTSNIKYYMYVNPQYLEL